MERELEKDHISNSLHQGYILRFFWIVFLLITFGCEVDSKRKEKELLDEISGVLDKTKELGDSIDKLKMKDMDYKWECSINCVKSLFNPFTKIVI